MLMMDFKFQKAGKLGIVHSEEQIVHNSINPTTSSLVEKIRESDSTSSSYTSQQNELARTTINKRISSNALVFESCVLENDKSIWILDSGSTNHVSCSLQLLEKWNYLKSRELKLKVGNGEMVSVRARGKAKLKFQNRILELDNVLYIPNFSRNLVSVSCLQLQQYKLDFSSSGSTIF